MSQGGRGAGRAPGDDPAAEGWRFGVEPLAQARALAPRLREVAGLVLALEEEDPAVDWLLAQLRDAERRLADRLPADRRPRVGPGAGPGAGDARRVYLDHSRAIGSYNPCFPEYRIEVHGPRASGTVAFPLAFEGPPGVVHGGFLALFFDCVIQHHNCDLGVAGKTTSLTVDYHRPAPLLETLRFEVDRSLEARRITSRARLLLGDTELCTATVAAVAGDRSGLPEVSPRRSPG